MKKRILSCLLAASMTVAWLPSAAMAAETEAGTEAGTESMTEAETEQEPEFDVADYLTINDDKYKGIEVTVTKKAEVSDKDVEDEIKQEASDAGLSTQVKKGTVKDGDTVNIDYVGKKDGKAFDGGTASGADLTIGSHTFIDGFESGLIGKKVGDTVDLDLTFPENYASKDLAGQKVVFTVTINYIEGEPEVNDDLADKLSGGEYKDIDDFKKSVREKLEQDNETNYNREVYSAIFQQLLKLYPVDKYPQEFIDYYVNTSMNQLQQQAEDESETLDDMLKSVYNTDADSTKAYFKTYAEQLLQQRIILGVIAQKENITLSDDDFQSAVEGYAQQYGISVDDFLSYYSEKDIRESELENRVMEFLASKAKITETDETEIETEELEVETEAGQTEAETSSAEADTES